MKGITPLPREERERAWREKYGAEEEAEPKEPAPRPLNLRAVLDLGNLVFFNFRGRAYGVPPLPWREGEALLDAKLEMARAGYFITDESRAGYYGGLRRIAQILWRNTRPVGRIRRLRKRLGLLPNELLDATDVQLVQLADFYSARRMTSVGLGLPEPNAPGT